MLPVTVFALEECTFVMGTHGKRCEIREPVCNIISPAQSTKGNVLFSHSNGNSTPTAVIFRHTHGEIL